MPYFFQEEKGKAKNQVEPITDSFVNKLRGIIKNKNFNFKFMSEFDYHVLMTNPQNTSYDERVINTYTKLANEYHFKLANNKDEDDDNFSYIIKYCKETLSEYGYTREEICDQLVFYLFNRISKKSLLWFCYGDILLGNIKQNADLTKQYCKKCGKRFSPSSNNHKYCDDCFEERLNNKAKILICSDCGCEYTVYGKSARRSKRCPECSKKAKTEAARLRKARQRERNQ